MPSAPNESKLGIYLRFIFAFINIAITITLLSFTFMNKLGPGPIVLTIITPISASVILTFAAILLFKVAFSKLSKMRKVVSYSPGGIINTPSIASARIPSNQRLPAPPPEITQTSWRGRHRLAANPSPQVSSAATLELPVIAQNNSHPASKHAAPPFVRSVATVAMGNSSSNKN